MDKTEIIRMHALQLARQPYYAAGQASIYLKKGGYCYVTDPGADFRQFEYACISDITDKADILKDVLMDSRDLEALVVARPPYASICAASGRDIVASLDDMAQIVGRRVMALPETYREIRKALQKAGAVMISTGDPCVVTAGRTLYEACIAQVVLEKAAEVNLKSTVIGGRKPLSAADCRKMRANYRKNYSRAEIDYQEALEQGRVAGAGNEGFVPEDKAAFTDKAAPTTDKAALLVKYGRLLQKEGLVQGTWGNLSLRLDREYMLCTPSGIDYEHLRPEDMVTVKISNLKYQGDRKPTSERGLHAAIYASRPEVEAVIHTHAKNCSVFAAAEMPLQVEDKACLEKLGEVIRIAGYALPGSRKLTRRTMEALGQGQAAIMAHHGMVCCGKNLEEAFRNCCLMEAAAEGAIDRRMK